MNYKNKIDYLKDVIGPELESAFKRGDKKYTGSQHWLNKRIVDREPMNDIRHIHECHVAVRLREAEDNADGMDYDASLRKIESAIGYLVLLHYRVNKSNNE